MLHIHRAERTDRLADALASLLTVPLDDAFACEVVAVPARGVERWLAQRLSHRLGTSGDGTGDGIAANIEFPSPAALVADAVEAAGGIARGEDPWRADRLVWPVLELVDECAGQPWCATVGRYLGALEGTPHAEAELRQGRRFATAAMIAGLFTSYGAQRPQMVRAWAAGDDTDGTGAALDAHTMWQAELWRRVRARLGVDSPAERLPRACDRLVAQPSISDLPARLSVFGPTRLSVDQVSVLSALAANRDVHVLVQHPSPVLWDRIAAAGRSARPGGLPRRRDDPTSVAATHPLLASLGRDSRELQLAIQVVAPDAVGHHHPAAGAGAAAAADAPTLLALLQSGIAADRLPGATALPVPVPGDRSIQVHACHGRARQVEVLREVVLGLLADDETLQPRDILVMCPDIETFAPLISATFGLGPGEPGVPTHPGHAVRVRLADRALRQTNPVLGVVATVLSLADARVTATQVLDLAAAAPVRRRFGFDDDGLERIRAWVLESGVRWGFDERHRQAQGSIANRANTWRSGLDRILLGVAMTGREQRYLDVAIGLDDVDSGDIALAGRLAEFVERLAEAVGALSGRRGLAAWLAALGTGMDSLADVDEDDAWQVTQARRVLAELGAGAAAAAGYDPELGLSDVRALLGDRLGGRPTRANFRTGDLTVCSLVPMRSVPHRVVCLIGMDDGALAHGAGGNGDDILGADPVMGERDRRSEARQMILDALLAAGDTLVFIYAGADERTGAVLPPAVPLGEILDSIDLTVGPGSSPGVREPIVVRHPLQPYDPRNFEADALGGHLPFSFDPHAAAGARAAGAERSPVPSFLSGPLPPAPRGDTVDLTDLVRFLEHPVRRFLRNRLGVSLDRGDDELSDALPVTLAPLESWAVGERLLTARVAGASLDAARQAEFRRGHLPPGVLGYRALDRAVGEVEPLVAASQRWRRGPATSVDVDVELPDGRRLTGTVADIHADPEPAVVRVVFSRLGPKHRVRAWAQVLALSAGAMSPPGGLWRAVTVGRNPGYARAGAAARARSAQLEAPPPHEALAELARLVDLYDRGMSEPLQLVLKTSHAYAAAVLGHNTVRDALYAAGQEWLSWSESGPRGEATESEHALVWGESAPFDRLTAAPPPPGESGPGWLADPSRFGVLALRLWSGLLAAERSELL